MAFGFVHGGSGSKCNRALQLQLHFARRSVCSIERMFMFSFTCPAGFCRLSFLGPRAPLWRSAQGEPIPSRLSGPHPHRARRRRCTLLVCHGIDPIQHCLLLHLRNTQTLSTSLRTVRPNPVFKHLLPLRKQHSRCDR